MIVKRELPGVIKRELPGVIKCEIPGVIQNTSSQESISLTMIPTSSEVSYQQGCYGSGTGGALARGRDRMLQDVTRPGGETGCYEARGRDRDITRQDVTDQEVTASWRLARGELYNIPFSFFSFLRFRYSYQGNPIHFPF